ncbi:MAG: fatty acid desaturase [Sphingobium sp.]|nr:fatty acid desaturase [Sphingobium sp.]
MKLDGATAGEPAKAAIGRTPDDKVMLRAAAELPRELLVAKGAVYWPDFLASTLIGYGGLAVAILSHSTLLALAGAFVAALALFRAASFIHELTHIRAGALPGFRFAWNALIGIPLLLPSFMYEEVHTHHHARTRYGTIEDPEYLPLALMKPWSLPLFILAALLAPVALLIRFAVIAPLGLIIPPLRRYIVSALSGLAINASYRRRPPEGAFRRMWIVQETAASLWAMGILTASALYGWRPLLIGMAVFSGVAVVNQLRTLVAHLWENEGEPMTVTGQFLDSVNVPPPGFVAELWAPVGLRYHALHHLLPSMPYHSYGEAHRRLVAAVGFESTYHHANHPGLIVLVMRIARSTMVRR